MAESVNGFNSQTIKESMISIAAENDKTYKDIFVNINDLTASIEDPKVPLKERYELIISVEFLLVRLRLKITEEQITVKSIINDKSAFEYESLIPLFKKRDSVLSSYQARLNDVREDVIVLQKLIYSYNTQNIKNF